MLRTIHLISLCACLLAPAALAQESPRTFTNKKGQSFVGTYDQSTDEVVTIVRQSDGKEFTIRIDSLSAEDQAYIAEIHATAVDVFNAGGGGEEASSATSEKFPIEIPGNLPKELYPRSMSEISAGISAIQARPSPKGFDAYQGKALNDLNVFRYLAGVPSEVTLDKEKVEQAQQAADALEAHGQFSREIGSFTEVVSQYGSQKDNNDAVAAIPSLIYDDSSANQETRGNRLNLLNPALETTGFGQSETSFATLHTLKPGRGKAKEDYTFPAAGFHPLTHFFTKGWTYHLRRGDAPERENVKVEVRKLDHFPTEPFGWKDELPGSPVKHAPEIMPVFTSRNCIIFEPSIEEVREPGVYWVRISGRGVKVQYPVVLY